jgi:pilus assembly protein CpaE
MTVILTDATDDVARYQFTLGEKVNVTSSIYELYDFISKTPEERLIIIGPNIKIDSARSIATHFRLERPDIGVILIRKRIEVGVLTEALRAGIREVVSSDDAGALVAASKRSLGISDQIAENSMLQGSGSTQGKVLMVFSAKGGCGKTTTAINLAFALSQEQNLKVALLDFDLQFGDIAIALQIDPKKTISDAISMQGNIDELGIQSLMINHSKNLDVLLAPTNPTDVEFITGKLVENLISRLKLTYDYIVVDSPPAFTEAILQVFDMADRCFLLTTLDMPALKNLKIVNSTLEALNVPKSKLEYVLNRSDMKTGLSLAEVEEALGEKFSVQIPSSVDVSSSTNRGVPIVVENPRHPVSKAFLSLAAETNRLLRPNKVKEKSGFFSRKNK